MSILRRVENDEKKNENQLFPETVTYRRIEVTLERERTIWTTCGSKPDPNPDASGQPAATSAETPPPQRTTSLKSPSPNCPVCGEAKMILIASSPSDFVSSQLAVQRNLGAHIHQSPSGEWWICLRSLNLI
jgi:hypothetical protein